MGSNVLLMYGAEGLETICAQLEFSIMMMKTVLIGGSVPAALGETHNEKTATPAITRPIDRIVRCPRLAGMGPCTEETDRFVFIKLERYSRTFMANAKKILRKIGGNGRASSMESGDCPLDVYT